MLTRRNFVSLVSALPVMLGSISVSTAQPNSATTPGENLLESGDFVFPRKPDDYIPYFAREAQQFRSYTEDEAEWNATKKEFLATAKEKFPYLSDSDIETIRQLSFAEFYTAYVGTVVPREPQVLQHGFSLYVGHVGIIQVDKDGKWVIEALAAKGVAKQRYADWLSGRPNELVWLGRLKDQALVSRQKVSNEAAKYIGRPYRFWNLDLNDDSEFYCSKLAWMAIFRSLDLAVDGNRNPKRRFWFSPKQLLYAPPVEGVFSPRVGPYFR